VRYLQRQIVVTRNKGTKALLILWALIWIASILIPVFQEPTGDSFTRGLNRIGTFFGLQILAALVGLVLLALRPKQGPYRWLTLVPLILAIALVLALAAIVMWARMSDPVTVAPGPTTQPAADAMTIPTE